MKANELELIDLHDEDEYEEWLNEVFPEEVSICGLLYSQSNSLKKLDYCAFREGYNNWINTFENVWECGECFCQHSSEDEAEECCKEDE